MVRKFIGMRYGSKTGGGVDETGNTGAHKSLACFRKVIGSRCGGINLARGEPETAESYPQHAGR